MTRILSVFKFLKRVGFAVLVLGGVAYACSSEWTNLGAPPSPIQSLSFAPGASLIVCGTTRDFQNPNSGGIYTRSFSDTSWQYSGLIYHNVNDLKRFEFNPQILFAATSEALYRTIDDGYTWDTITTLGTEGFIDQVSFAVSPFDSMEWLLGATELGIGRLYVSHDAGATWQTQWVGAQTFELSYSLIHESTVYFANGSQLCKYNTATDTTEVLYEFWGQSIRTLAQHLTEPYLYFNSRDTLGRYNESTGEVLLVPIPGAGASQRVLYWPPDALLLGTQDSLFLVDVNLLNWRAITNGPQGASTPRYCTQNLQIVTFTGQLYCRDLSASPISEHSRTSDRNYRVYPNPFNSTLSITLDAPLYSDVTVLLYDLLGREVDVVYRGRLFSQTISYAAPVGMASGVYFLRASAASQSVMRKVVLLK